MSNKKQKVLIITGPTSVGKTSLGIKLAKKFDGEIISADSVQVYTGFDIGSAKVKAHEMQGVMHHLIDVMDAQTEYSAGEFARAAKTIIEDLGKRKKLPIVVGGTGLYISSLLFPLDSACGRDESYRQKLEELAKEKGKQYLHKMLEGLDPESAAVIHENQMVRIVRALEIFHLTGKKKSELERQTTNSEYEYLLIVLDRDRNEVYAEIDKRVDQMVSDGLVEEVQGLLESGVEPDAPAMKGIGYKEIVMYLEGVLTLEESVNLIKQRTRNYAKRQLTYFRKMTNACFVRYNDIQKIEEMVNNFVGE